MDVAAHAAKLRGEGVPHALATVVRSRQPSSGKPGDRAIVTTDRRLEGWVGGACAESIVVAEGVEALAAGAPRYVVLDAEVTEPTTEGDRFVHPLTCHSGGAIELFIEPFAPPATVAIVGASPVAAALSKLCRAAGFEVTDDVASAGAETFVVVATMGRADEDAALAALAAGAPYVAVVASRRRAAALRDWLTAKGIDEDALAALHAPAGLDLGARGAEGVAVSILAQIVEEQARHGGLRARAQRAAVDVPELEERAVDPVCGMSADPASAPSATHDGETYYFCATHCREAFLAAPETYLATTD